MCHNARHIVNQDIEQHTQFLFESVERMGGFGDRVFGGICVIIR